MAVRIDVPHGRRPLDRGGGRRGAASVSLVVADDVGRDTGIRLTTADAAASYAELAAAGVDVDPEVLRWPGVPRCSCSAIPTATGSPSSSSR